MKLWFSVISDLFVNIAAAWFAIALIQPQVSKIDAQTTQLLIIRLAFGILSLTIAKKLREESKII